MKQRINISIDYEVLEEAKKHIENISAYLEGCLKRANANEEYRKKQKLKEDMLLHGYTEEDKETQKINKDMEELIKVVNTQWVK